MSTTLPDDDAWRHETSALLHSKDIPQLTQRLTQYQDQAVRLSHRLAILVWNIQHSGLNHLIDSKVWKSAKQASADLEQLPTSRIGHSDKDYVQQYLERLRLAFDAFSHYDWGHFSKRSDARQLVRLADQTKTWERFVLRLNAAMLLRHESSIDNSKMFRIGQAVPTTSHDYAKSPFMPSDISALKSLFDLDEEQQASIQQQWCEPCECFSHRDKPHWGLQLDRHGMLVPRQQDQWPAFLRKECCMTAAEEEQERLTAVDQTTDDSRHNESATNSLLANVKSPASPARETLSNQGKKRTRSALAAAVAAAAAPATKRTRTIPQRVKSSTKSAAAYPPPHLPARLTLTMEQYHKLAHDVHKLSSTTKGVHPMLKQPLHFAQCSALGDVDDASAHVLCMTNDDAARSTRFTDKPILIPANTWPDRKYLATKEVLANNLLNTYSGMHILCRLDNKTEHVALPVEDIAARVRGDKEKSGKGIMNALSLDNVLGAVKPAFTYHPDFNLLALCCISVHQLGQPMLPDEILRIVRKLDYAKEAELDSCLAFAIWAQANCFSGFHLDILVNTWLTCHFGLKLVFIPKHWSWKNVEHWRQLANDGHHWMPPSGAWVIPLFPGDTLIFTGPHAVLTVEDSAMSGGMFWHRKTMLHTVTILRQLIAHDTASNELMPLQLARALDALAKMKHDAYEDRAAVLEQIAAINELGCKCDKCTSDTCPCFAHDRRCGPQCSGRHKTLTVNDGKQDCYCEERNNNFVV